MTTFDENTMNPAAGGEAEEEKSGSDTDAMNRIHLARYLLGDLAFDQDDDSPLIQAVLGFLPGEENTMKPEAGGEAEEEKITPAQKPVGSISFTAEEQAEIDLSGLK